MSRTVVEHNDPYSPQVTCGRPYALPMDAAAIKVGSLAQYDWVAIVTDHRCFDYRMIAEQAIPGRNLVAALV